jgi:hypothetical protein
MMMIKLNSVIYNKLLLQAQEAKDQGMSELSTVVLNAIGSYPEEEQVEYSYTKLNEDVYQGMWKLATAIFKYHDIESVNIEKINEVIESLAGNFVDKLENSMDVELVIKGPLEPKVMGEK